MTRNVLGGWVAPFHYCPACKASLNWHEDAERSQVRAVCECGPVEFALHLAGSATLCGSQEGPWIRGKFVPTGRICIAPRHHEGEHTFKAASPSGDSREARE